MVQGKLGRVKARNTNKAFKGLKKVGLPTPLAKAGANRVGQATKLVKTKKKRKRRY